MTNYPVRELPSERSFGLLFVFVLLCVAGYGYIYDWGTQILASLAVASAILVIISLIVPHILAPFNRAWMFLGHLLGKIVNPIVMGIIFFGLLTPVGILTRAFGRGELRLKLRQSKSWWISREPPGPNSDSFTNQF